jgi:trimethylamine-N-oxide reductase (cytochrome c)
VIGWSRLDPLSGILTLPRQSSKGLADRVYSPTRVRFPSVRASYLKGKWQSDSSKRGADEFVRVSWEQALGLVASELQRVKGTYGNEAIHSHGLA